VSRYDDKGFPIPAPSTPVDPRDVLIATMKAEIVDYREALDEITDCPVNERCEECVSVARKVLAKYPTEPGP
jgi:hypothetical protein